MVRYGLGFGFLFAQLLSILFVLAWIGLAIYCLIQLRKQALSATAKALWTLIILVLPVVGAIAYLVVKPSEG